MFDDISFVPASISIMSRLKQSPISQQHSLSRIIREQALIYQEEVPDEDIALCLPKQTPAKKPKTSKDSKTQTYRQEAAKGTKVKEAFKRQTVNTYTYKISAARPKIDEMDNNNPPEEEIRATERKINLLVFEDLDQPTDRSPAKKEKRTIKQTFDEQKTKKIDFQDLHRTDSPEKSLKKDQLTKIKQKEHLLHQNSSCKKGVLQLLSKQSSDMQFQEKDLSVLEYQLKTNNKVLMNQLKELIAMNRWESIQLQKVELRKILVKTDTEIKRLKIGFRGLTESCDTLCRSKSKLKQRDSSQSNIKKTTSGLRSKLKPKTNLLHADYRQDDFEPQLSKSCIQSSNLKEKMDYLHQQIKKTRKQQSKLKSQLTEITSKYTHLKQDPQHHLQFVPTPSTINRNKILKEKVQFLKTEIKQTKKYYSNRIKRFKNENNLLKNEMVFTNKEIQEIKKCIRNIEKNEKKYREQILSKKERGNEEYKLKTQECISKINSLQQGTNYNIVDPKSGKSINSINSVNSLRSANSAQSIGSKPSISSYKSTKQTSGDTGQQHPSPSKPKLKLASSHAAVIPSISSSKQYSTLAKRKQETQIRLGIKDGGIRQKKPTSLDIAFKQLQQKYEIHCRTEPNEDIQYYNRPH